MSMNMGKRAIYWHKNQVTLHFGLRVSATASNDVKKKAVQSYLDDLNEHVLNDVSATVSFSGKNTVSPARFQNATGTEEGVNEPDALDNVYLFPLPPQLAIEDSVDNSDVIGFFQINTGP